MLECEVYFCKQNEQQTWIGHFDVTKLHRQVTNLPKWWRSLFGVTLHVDFISLESSLEAEISVSILPLYLLCIGERKGAFWKDIFL